MVDLQIEFSQSKFRRKLLFKEIYHVSKIKLEQTVAILLRVIVVLLYLLFFMGVGGVCVQIN